MRTFARALCVLLCLVFPAQQAAALAVPACEHVGGAETPAAVTPASSHDHHAMHGGTAESPAAQSPELASDCECGCPCALGACLHASVTAAVFEGLAMSGLRFTSDLPSFADVAHAPASAAVALRPPISS